MSFLMTHSQLNDLCEPLNVGSFCVSSNLDLHVLHTASSFLLMTASFLYANLSCSLYLWGKYQ